MRSRACPKTLHVVAFRRRDAAHPFRSCTYKRRIDPPRKREDQQRVRQAHPTTPVGHPVPDLAAALGWRIDPWRELRREVRGDLDPTVFGIDWWQLGPETDDELRRRIVVGDYLVAAANLVSTLRD